MKNTYMNYYYSHKLQGFTLMLVAVLCWAPACTSKDQSKGNLAEKKARWQQLKSQQLKLAQEIQQLEGEIRSLDTTASATAKQVEVITLAPANFTHFIDLQGKIDAEDISYVTPRGMGGQVVALYIKKGDAVKKGQLLLKMDDAILQQNLKQLQSQLDFARNIFQRQKNLWDQGIGTEVQFLTAKNNVEALEKQIATLNEQLSTTRVYSEATGIADEVNVRVGEFFQGLTAAGPQIKIVNTSRLKAVVDIPENYISRIQKGTKVQVSIPDLSKQFSTEITVISQSINPNSRGFTAEMKVAYDSKLKPNQIALIKIQDYAVSNIITIPVNLVQSDEKGKYVYVLETTGQQKAARRKAIVTGESYEGRIEVKSGLASGDQLISEGYQNLYEGQSVATVN